MKALVLLLALALAVVLLWPRSSTAAAVRELAGAPLVLLQGGASSPDRGGAFIGATNVGAGVALSIE